MTIEQAIEYGREERKWPRVLRYAADGAVFYPLVVVLLLYGEWAIGWLVLGHRPMPSLNDPSAIPISNWLQVPTGLAMLGLPLIGLGGLFLNCFYVVLLERSFGRNAARILGFVAIWAGVWVFLFSDPIGVLNWWFD